MLSWTIGMAVVLIAASGIGGILSLLSLLIACMISLANVIFVIPILIGLIPVLGPIIIWLINSANITNKYYSNLSNP